METKSEVVGKPHIQIRGVKMHRKVLNKQRDRKTGHYKGRLGTILGVQDCNGDYLKVGDMVRIVSKHQTGVILYNPDTDRYEIMLTSSRWYGDDVFDPNSYGKSEVLPMDNGAKMDIQKLKGV